jgi:F-type H+-transporting ATPase subunit b
MQRAALLTAALLVSTPAYAAGGEPGWTMVILHAINLVILLWVIYHFAGKPIAKALVSRAESVGKEIDEASRLHAEAKDLLATYETKLAGLESATAEILEGFKAQGEAEKQRLVEEAKTDAERIRRDAERTAQSEYARARERLEAEVVDLAIAAAEKAIRDKLTPADHRRLTGEYLSRLEEANRG